MIYIIYMLPKVFYYILKCIKKIYTVIITTVLQASKLRIKIREVLCIGRHFFDSVGQVCCRRCVLPANVQSARCPQSVDLQLAANVQSANVQSARCPPRDTASLPSLRRPRPLRVTVRNRDF